MQATPDDVLSALELHLKPLLATQLPSALRLFGHLTFLRDTVNEQASAALAVHAASRARGGLTDEEVEVIRGCIKPRGGEDMRRLSLEMRQAHMHLVLSNPKSDVDRLALMLDTYFPSLPEDEEERAEAQAAHKMPFIRHISAEEADGLEAYRAPFQWFLDDARAEKSAWPRIPGPRPKLTLIASNMLVHATEVVKDAEALTSVFSLDARDRRRSLPESGAPAMAKRPRASEPARVA